MQLCLGCQVNTHFFMVKHLGISSLQYFSDRSITQSLEIFSPLFETNSIGFISFPYHIHPYHFSKKILTPPAPFQFPHPHGPYP
jgi:hypothetical protein